MRIGDGQPTRFDRRLAEDAADQVARSYRAVAGDFLCAVACAEKGFEERGKI